MLQARNGIPINILLTLVITIPIKLSRGPLYVCLPYSKLHLQNHRDPQYENLEVGSFKSVNEIIMFVTLLH